MNKPTPGLLIMHYGTPASLEEVLPYYTHIRRGRPPSQEQFDDLVARYRAIGGPSPLSEISLRQAEAIHRALRDSGIEAGLYIGTKHAPPFIADAVQKMAEDGVDQAIGLVLAPHYSSLSVAEYKRYALDARDASRPGMEIDVIERWGALPELIDAFCDRVLAQMQGWAPDETLVVFTAHSLPQRAIAQGDPYQEELMETSRLVASRCGIPHWTFAFQSASQTGEPWLGPDVLDVIAENANRYRNILACTVGFVCDHLEVLYDLDFEAKDKCTELGLEFRRAETINDDPKVMTALGAVVASRFASVPHEF